MKKHTGQEETIVWSSDYEWATHVAFVMELELCVDCQSQHLRLPNNKFLSCVQHTSTTSSFQRLKFFM